VFFCRRKIDPKFWLATEGRNSGLWKVSLPRGFFLVEPDVCTVLHPDAFWCFFSPHPQRPLVCRHFFCLFFSVLFVEITVGTFSFPLMLIGRLAEFLLGCAVPFGGSRNPPKPQCVGLIFELLPAACCAFYGAFNCPWFEWSFLLCSSSPFGQVFEFWRSLFSVVFRLLPTFFGDSALELCGPAFLSAVFPGGHGHSFVPPPVNGPMRKHTRPCSVTNYPRLFFFCYPTSMPITLRASPPEFFLPFEVVWAGLFFGRCVVGSTTFFIHPTSQLGLSPCFGPFPRPFAACCATCYLDLFSSQMSRSTVARTALPILGVLSFGFLHPRFHSSLLFISDVPSFP